MGPQGGTVAAEDADMGLPPALRRRAARAGALVLLATLLAACGGGGSDTNTAPTISALSYGPAAVYVGPAGSTTDIGGTFEFADPEGNVDLLTLVVLDAGGATLSTTIVPIDIAGKPKSGLISGVFTVGSAIVGRYTFQVFVTDTRGNRSNTLSGGFRVADFPWVARSAMPAARRDFATATLGGLVYVTGGGDTLAGITPAPATDTLQVYDPATGNWSLGPSMPWPMTDHVAVAVGGELIVIGQVYDGGFKGRVQRFDPGTGLWTLGADGPLGRTQAAAAVLDGKVHVVGGTEGGNDLTSMAIYDPAADAWTSGAAMAAPRRDLAAAALAGRLLALGGYTTAYIDDGGYRRAVEQYDPATLAWGAAPAMLEARADLAVAVVGTQLFAIGGGNVTRALADVAMFDATTQAWTPKTAMPTGLAWPRAELVGGKVYVFDTAATYAYTPADDIL